MAASLLDVLFHRVRDDGENVHAVRLEVLHVESWPSRRGGDAVERVEHDAGVRVTVCREEFEGFRKPRRGRLTVRVLLGLVPDRYLALLLRPLREQEVVRDDAKQEDVPAEGIAGYSFPDAFDVFGDPDAPGPDEVSHRAHGRYFWEERRDPSGDADSAGEFEPDAMVPEVTVGDADVVEGGEVGDEHLGQVETVVGRESLRESVDELGEAYLSRGELVEFAEVRVHIVSCRV